MASLLLPCLLVAAVPQFREHTITTGLKGGYQVVAADLNADGRADLVALASGQPELVWFENPGWERHVLATGRSRMINVAVVSDSEMVLAEEFSMDPAKSIGIVSVLTRRGDPREPWAIREIDRLPTSHRLRTADIDGSGKKVVVNAPLAGAAARPPEYRARVPLVFYRPGSWKRELISDETEGVMHGLGVFDWDGGGRDEILTASFLGLHIFEAGRDGAWRRRRFAPGSPQPWPRCGSSEVAVGRLGKRRRYVCAIEPWHGNEVVVYLDEGRRHVIDDTLDGGHALLTADLDGDGRDEIVAGYRGKGRSVNIYAAADAHGTRWARRQLDAGGMGAASCVLADLNGDGRPDLACIDSTTLKWYEHLGAGR